MWCWYWCHCGLPSWQDLWLSHQWVCISFLCLLIIQTFVCKSDPFSFLWISFDVRNMQGLIERYRSYSEMHSESEQNKTQVRDWQYASSDATLQFKTINRINLCLEMVNSYEHLCAWLTRKLLLSAPVLGFYLSVMLTELHKVLLLLWKPILIYFILIEEIC